MAKDSRISRLTCDLIVTTIRFVEITFHSSKDAQNRRVHGISLRRAENFDMTTALIEQDDREDYGEVRYNAIGFLDARLYNLTFTLRAKAVRVISLRKATKKELADYAEIY